MATVAKEFCPGWSRDGIGNAEAAVDLEFRLESCNSGDAPVLDEKFVADRPCATGGTGGAEHSPGAIVRQPPRDAPESRSDPFVLNVRTMKRVGRAALTGQVADHCVNDSPSPEWAGIPVLPFR